MLDESGKMHAFVAQEGLARFCTEVYEKPTKENLKNNFMHLTNYSINKNSEKYVWEPKDILSINNGSKRTLTALFKELDALGLDSKSIKKSIQYSCQGILSIFSHMIQHQTTLALGPAKQSGKIFQIFGFDILLDKNKKAWILEINDHPSFNIYWQKTVTDLFGNKTKEEEVVSQVDLHVKK